MSFNKLLPNPDFLRWLLRAIDDARESVIVVNYMAALDEKDRNGPVARIAMAFIRAVKRGVRIEVVLEGTKLKENYLFYRRLKDAGANVWMDTSLTFIHTKAVLIGDRMLSIGSHNITTSALVYHEETSLVTNDSKVIKRFNKEYERYTEQRREVKGAEKRGAWLQGSVIFSPDGSKDTAPLIKIKRAIAPRVYSLYLLLCRLDGGRPRPLDVEADMWAQTIGLSPRKKVSAYEHVTTLIEYMDRTLGVVKWREKDKTVERCPLALCKGRILLPDAFWDFGWHLRLPVEAIHLYLAGEAERMASPYAPWWRLGRDGIAKRYGFQKQLVNRAGRVLRRYDLLEVLYETSTSAYRRYIRYINYYRQNPFYDYEARKAKINALKGRYPAEVLRLARGITERLYLDSDLFKIRALCEDISAHGIARGRTALRNISRISQWSTRLNFHYARKLLKVGDAS